MNEMLRQMIHNLELVLAFVLITLSIFIIMALVTIKPAIATITETDLDPG